MGSHPLVAAFPTYLGAHGAAVSLREGGFHEMWIGVTAPDDVVLTVATDDYPELAGEIVAGAGGIVLCGDTFYCATAPAPTATVPTIAREVDLSGVVRLSERRKAPRHLAPYKQVS